MVTAPPETLLCGRERELSCVRDLLEYGRRGGTALLTVEGVPGSGKTRLLRETVVLAKQLGFRVGDEAAVDCGVRRSRYRCGSAARPGDHCRHTASVHPTLVVVDEADGLPGRPAGAGAAEWRGPRSHAVWVAARRSSTGPDPFRGLRSDPTRRGERLVLGSLSSAASLRLAAEHLGGPLSLQLAELVEQAAGNPGLIVELLTGLQEERGLGTVHGRTELLTDRLPERLHGRVRATLGQHSRECRQLLSVASLLGSEVVYEELAPILSTYPAALLLLLEEACATGAMRHDGGRVVFAGELVRRVIAESVPATLRQALLREADALRSPRQPAEADPPPRATAPTPLSAQQHTLIQLVSEGLTNRQIARRLDLSPHTVNYHLRKLFRGFGVNSRIDLLRAAARHGTPVGAGSREP
ncbi:LuxR C-terminal-related transcriptional regulator [Kitasatospora sp. HPMI-4]